MSWLHYVSADAILPKLPDSEQQFLLEHATRILGGRKSGSAPVQKTLADVTQILADKQYGWEEAILDDKWYRYPSEIREQRFCSEEALKNYLLLRTMGIPAIYCLMDNYNDTKMAHEAILVPDKERLWMVDWYDVALVTIGEKGLEKSKGKRIKYDQITFLPEQQVLDRVSKLRSGESFLDALACGQILYRKLTDHGEIQAHVYYSPKNTSLSFLFQLLPITNSKANFRFTHSTILHQGELQTQSGLDICLAKGTLGLDKIAFEMEKKEYLEAMLDFCDEKNMLDVGMQILYDAFLEIHPDGEYNFSPQDRKKTLVRWKECQQDSALAKSSRKECGKRIEFVEFMQKNRPALAQRFIDFTLARDSLIAADKYNQRYIFERLQQNCGIADPLMYMIQFLAINSKYLAQSLSLESMFTSHQKLRAVLSQKVGLPFTQVTPDHYIQTLESFQQGESAWVIPRKQAVG